ncbi:hypothetical protein ACFIQG_20500 [Comamonas odontotermitis]|uniref:hypothetical protein n=1 Tax=Comamonas odontotermitis TaxID=379895 RepID=UPI00366AA052
MTPNIAPPTDNIYKFACLFGLALVISSIFGFISIYTSSLDRKIEYSKTVIPLEAKEQRTKAEESMLAMGKTLIEVTKSNESFASALIAIVLAAGLLLSWYGASKWHTKIQARDDIQSLLLLEKMRAEINKLKLEAKALEQAPAASNES